MGGQLAKAVDSQHHSLIKDGHLTIGCVEMNGRRRENEDSSCARKFNVELPEELELTQPLESTDEKGVSKLKTVTKKKTEEKKTLESDNEYFLGVFDGHCGSKTSELLPELLHKHLHNRGIAFKSAIEQAYLDCDMELKSIPAVSESGSCAVVAIVGNAILTSTSYTSKGTDQSEAKHDNTSQVGDKRKRHPDENDGTSDKKQKTTTLRWPVKIMNLGDSRAMLINLKDGSVAFVTQDHKPDDEEERARIEKCEGFVSGDRVCGQLAVSRAFGDFPYKSKKDCSLFDQQVTAKPAIYDIEATSDQALLLFCDGVLENGTKNEWIADFITKELAKSRSSPQLILAELLRQCLWMHDSNDNMTAMLVLFNETKHDSYSKEKKFVIGRNVPNYKDFEGVMHFARAFWADAARSGVTEATAPPELKQVMKIQTRELIERVAYNDKKNYEAEMSKCSVENEEIVGEFASDRAATEAEYQKIVAATAQLLAELEAW